MRLKNSGRGTILVFIFCLGLVRASQVSPLLQLFLEYAAVFSMRTPLLCLPQELSKQALEINVAARYRCGSVPPLGRRVGGGRPFAISILKQQRALMVLVRISLKFLTERHLIWLSFPGQCLSYFRPPECPFISRLELESLPR